MCFFCYKYFDFKLKIPLLNKIHPFDNTEKVYQSISGHTIENWSSEKPEQNWTRVSGILLFNLNFWKIEEYNNAKSIWGRLYEKVKRDFHHHFENTSPFWLDWNELKMTRPNGRNSTTNEMTYLVGLFRYIFWQHVNISR